MQRFGALFLAVLSLFIGATAARADHIVTVSEYSKRRISECLRVRPEKVSVIYNGVGSEFHIGEPQRVRNAVAELDQTSAFPDLGSGLVDLEHDQSATKV